MNGSALRTAAGTALVVLAVAACGTAASHTPGTASPTHAATSSPPAGNGVAGMSAQQATRAALAALDATASVHVTGTWLPEGRSERFDMRFEGASASGSFTLKGAPVQAVSCGGFLYMKAGTDGWAAMGNPRDTAGMMAGRWFKVGHTEAAAGESPMSLGFFTSELAARTATPGSVARGSLAGRQVVIVSYQDGSKLYIEPTGAAYPMRFDVTGGTGGHRDFSEYGTRFGITVPSGAINTA